MTEKPPRRTPTPRDTAPPDSARLRDAALAHLARFAATEATLLRVLQRRIQRWKAAAAAQQDADAAAIEAARRSLLSDAQDVVRTLRDIGAVDDAAFASARARRLQSAGRSRRVVQSHLAARGISTTAAQAALAADDLPAALVFARRRKLGPFAIDRIEPEGRQRMFGIMARAGFDRQTATRVMAMTEEDATAALDERRNLTSK